MSVEFSRESPGKFDSRTLSRETLSRWTGRKRGGLPGSAESTVLSLRILSLRIDYFADS